MISSKTSFLALIGNPIEHSLSPIMQNAAINYMNLDLVYLAFPCQEKDFYSIINALKKINCLGLNITIPYKEKVFDLCDEISPIAKKVKAINTLKLNHKKEWSGINTDVEGFIYPLKNYDLKNKKSIVLGSGGAARAAIQGLINLKLSEINIISRNIYALEKIINDFENHPSLNIYLNRDIRNLELIEDSDVIINSTPIGMNNQSDNQNVLPFGINFWKSLSSKTIIYDLVYNPRPTNLLKLGQQKNCITIDGSEMLVAQGAKSLSYWTGELDIPINIMKNALNNYL